MFVSRMTRNESERLRGKKKCSSICLLILRWHRRKKKFSSQTFFRSDEITEKQLFDVKHLNSCIFKKKRRRRRESTKANHIQSKGNKRTENDHRRFCSRWKNLTVLYKFRIVWWRCARCSFGSGIKWRIFKSNSYNWWQRSAVEKCCWRITNKSKRKIFSSIDNRKSMNLLVVIKFRLNDS